MDGLRELEKAWRDAVGAVRRAREAYSMCLLNDPGGCALEQESLAAAEKRLRALERKLAEARRREGVR